MNGLKNSLDWLGRSKNSKSEKLNKLDSQSIQLKSEGILQARKSLNAQKPMTNVIEREFVHYIDSSRKSSPDQKDMIDNSLQNNLSFPNANRNASPSDDAFSKITNTLHKMSQNTNIKQLEMATTILKDSKDKISNEQVISSAKELLNPRIPPKILKEYMIELKLTDNQDLKKHIIETISKFPDIALVEYANIILPLFTNFSILEFAKKFSNKEGRIKDLILIYRLLSSSKFDKQLIIEILSIDKAIQFTQNFESIINEIILQSSFVERCNKGNLNKCKEIALLMKNRLFSQIKPRKKYPNLLQFMEIAKYQEELDKRPLHSLPDIESFMEQLFTNEKESFKINSICTVEASKIIHLWKVRSYFDPLKSPWVKSPIIHRMETIFWLIEKSIGREVISEIKQGIKYEDFEEYPPDQIINYLLRLYCYNRKRKKLPAIIATVNSI